jgi:divalent metal cation (Fe/Co/Zn/Cd) transporter
LLTEVRESREMSCNQIAKGGEQAKTDQGTAGREPCACADGPASGHPPCCEGASQAVGTPDRTAPRARLLRRGLSLEYMTVGWNVIEGLVSVAAAVGAGSVALLGFGIDSFVETASGLVLIWRLRAESRARDAHEVERLDARAHKLVGLSLFLLAAYIAFDAARALITRERPEPTMVGFGVTSLSLVAMWWLARAKRRAARDLESRALAADSLQTTACFWLSLITLVGIAANAAFGWWWADPVAALGMTWFLVSEGREAWYGEECGCGGG